MELPEELPQLYKRHIFACSTQRPPMHPKGSCGANGALPLWEHLGNRIEALGLGAEVGFTASGCLGFCTTGPLLVIYPEGVWYRPKTTEDIDRIITSHLQQEELAEDLVVVLSR
ncbi:(2Fe-2S) ferredoxin domain-containing protein [Alteraurantiacibacter aquimixticola]|uniref:(2Fe-2S) ferredoxin domain-containing protein n=1 Tax=Alteraurantiacibacter aquimixticola TaxID=2489173 RepID=A0A4T3F308_9SPHN|nr:(2Fe-2S) ferredoxin domain-containing protein [Alteraurantiacibacter aquimixticola]TIX51626.1 (2Fe-2S) ferredoxin domain-containing protein [Alteraurantiacibacter aquimixticola]